MLHIWLIPMLVIVALGVGILLCVIKLRGGSGVRTSGRTVVDKTVEGEEDFSNK